MATVIIQARTSSKRFPNKVIKKLFDKQLLYFLYLRLRESKLIKTIIISTSKLSADKKIETICKKNKIIYFKGSHQNVLLRLYLTAKKFKLTSFVRISADSPLMDSKIVDKGIKIFNKNKADLVTNVFPRSYPKGQSVEIVKTSTLGKILKEKLNRNDKEHVTKYIYDNPKKFKIINFKNKKNKSKLNLSIDKKKDLQNMQRLFFINKRNLLKMNLNNIIKKYEN